MYVSATKLSSRRHVSGVVSGYKLLVRDGYMYLVYTRLETLVASRRLQLQHFQASGDVTWRQHQSVINAHPVRTLYIGVEMMLQLSALTDADL